MRHDVLSAAKTLLETSGRPIGDGNPPSESPDRPYAIMYDLGFGVAAEGSMEDEEEWHDLALQITCVGEDHRQVRWMSDALFALFIDNSTELVVATATVVWRRSVRRGAILPSGTNLFQSNDEYQLRIER